MTALPSVLSLVPRIPKALPRPRLDDALAAGDPGLLVLGPAGSGKTVLASRLSATKPRAAWARLAPGYDSAADLVAIAAASAGREVSTSGASIIDLAGELLALLEREPTVVVVDDYHEGRGEECDPLVAELLPLVPPDGAVVLCSRVRPPGLLGRTAEGLLRVVDAAELAFTDEEAAQLFEQRGGDPEAAIATRHRMAGWAAGVALAAEARGGGDEATDRLVRDVLLRDAAEAERKAVRALAVLPYLTRALATTLDIADASALDRVATRTMLVTEESGYWRLHEVARQTLLSDVPAEEARELRRRAALAIEATDRDTAIDVLIDNGDHQAAADMLARHASTIEVARAVHWLYRLPPELRRQFPPAIAAGKATVDLDEAVARAQSRVDAAPDDAARREALFALGSAHAGAGALSSAAASFEAAVTPGASASLRARGNAWLGVVRWWAGDLVGARAALAAAGDDAVGAWAAAEVELAAGNVTDAERHADRARSIAAEPDADLTEAPSLSVLARLALAAGDPVSAAERARAAYRLASEAQGVDLAAAGPIHAWVLVNAGEYDQALAVAELVDRRIGRHDAFAKLHVHLIRLAVATARHDRDAMRSADTRVHQLRQRGFAVVEAQARTLLTPLAAAPQPALRVNVLGPSRTELGGESLPRSAWKSHKALEVLQYLALAGERGAHREEVIEAVWPEREPDKGRMLLRAALSEIRRRLEPGRQAGEPSRFVHTVGDRVHVEATTDLAEARVLAKAGQTEEALACFRGELLEDNPYVEWAFDERWAAERLREELSSGR